jgi:hypothetical protein
MSAPAMIYDDRLVEEAVTQTIDAKAKAGDGSAFRSYHEMSDGFYTLTSGTDRIESFRRLHLYFFARFGFKQSIEEPIRRSRCYGRLARVVVSPALKHEYADLARGSEGFALLLRLKPETIRQPAALDDLLRRELTAAEDMLDPGFGYTPDPPPGLTAAEESLFRDRYGLLWRIYIDARLVRAGAAPEGQKNRRRDQFRAAYSSLDRNSLDSIFETLWERAAFTHAQLVRLAKDTASLLRVANLERGSCGPLPGSPCPVCRFPTHRWASDIEAIEQAVCRDFPSWRAEEGLCDRCQELYSVK